MPYRSLLSKWLSIARLSFLLFSYCHVVLIQTYVYGVEEKNVHAGNQHKKGVNRLLRACAHLVAWFFDDIVRWR